MIWSLLMVAVAGTPDDVQAALAAELLTQQVPGVSVAVVVDGELALAAAVGVSDRDARTPVTTETRFGVGSIGKTATATLIGQLVAEGVLTYNDTLGQHIPEVGDTYAAVTVHELLTHTSGVPRDFKRGDSFTGAKLYRKLRKSYPNFAHGGGWSYSNTGFILLGDVIERVTGLTLADAVLQRIVEPASMANAVVVEPGDDPERAVAYERREGPGARRFPMRFGAGNLVTTATDLALFDMALTSGSLLSIEAQQAQWTPPGQTVEIGLGTGETYTVGRCWWVGEVDGRRTVQHSGSIDGYNAIIERFVDDGVSIVVLTNAEYANLVPMLDILRDAYLRE